MGDGEWGNFYAGQYILEKYFNVSVIRIRVWDTLITDQISV